MRLALIDADTLVYASTTATEVATEWDEGLWTLHGFLPEAIEHFDRMVQEILKETKADEAIMALSSVGDVRWREKIMPTYKANRKGQRKPLLYMGIREHCVNKYRGLVRPTLEGDDILGILATHPNLALTQGATSKVIVSIDKDLKTIPGELYNYDKKKLTIIPEHVADYWHLLQSVMGDTTDGYPGCKGVGPVGAQKLLAPFCFSANGASCQQCDPTDPLFEIFDAAAAWKAIVKAYEKAKLGEEFALLNARVARICRAEDYDLEKKEVILWNPPK